MKKHTNVAGHLRQGKAVRPHVRSVEQREISSPDKKASVGHLLSAFEQEDPWLEVATESWVDRLNFAEASKTKFTHFIVPETNEVIGVRAEALGEVAEITSSDFVGEQEELYVDSVLLSYGVDYSGMNLRGYLFSGVFFNLNFADGNLDGVTFCNRKKTRSGYIQTGSLLTDCNFAGASLRGADFRYASFRGCSFNGADLTGADFSGVNIMTFGIDFRGSNLSREQFDSCFKGKGPILYDRYSLEDVAGVMDVSIDDAAVFVWAGGVEVRDENGEEVTSGFDSSLHHVPQWAMQELLRDHT